VTILWTSCRCEGTRKEQFPSGEVPLPASIKSCTGIVVNCAAQKAAQQNATNLETVREPQAVQKATQQNATNLETVLGNWRNESPLRFA
jgi:hypothetical protein